MRALLLVLLTACAADASSMPGGDPPAEITGSQVDPLNGRCTGVVGDQPDWARCTGRCQPLAEAACAATAGCRTAYSDDTGTAAEERVFRACLDVAPGTAVGACAALDALGCSRRDDCAALHFGLSFYAPFRRCEPERTTP